MGLLEQLAADYGFEDVDSLLESAMFDSVCPGICTTPGCRYSTDVEPDQDKGWCENCERGTIKSAFVLAGII